MMESHSWNNSKKYRVMMSVLFVITVFCFVSSISLGRYHISYQTILDVLFNQGANSSAIDRNVIVTSRIPRCIVACFSGIALSLSGVVYQNIFQNKLVSADLLGASSGASVGACIAILLGCSKAIITGSSFIVGILAVLLTISISKAFQGNATTMLLLSGIIISGLMDAIVGLTKFLADNDGVLSEITFWLMGDISKCSSSDLYFMVPIILIGAILIYVLRWKLNIIALGEYEAKTMGINYNFLKILLIGVATLLVATVVSVAGTIAWISLIIPHISRLLIGEDNKYVIPISLLLGADFMMIVDLLARTLNYSEIPLSIVTGFIGAPLFLITLWIRQGGRRK